MRKFNGREVELLAPAGNYHIFEALLDSGADAFYFGGKAFNMRLHRKDFNFSNEEIIKAIEKAHSLGKKVYVTVNNLLDQSELNEIVDYLRFLELAGPDAIIVQDIGLVKLIKDMKINLELHASVMMNVHNLEMINILWQYGVTRVVASRDIGLDYVKRMGLQTKMEFEYFVHGDMCAVHGSQCHYSGMLFGKSSNRGLCMKPCRWAFEIEKDGKRYKTTYPMAVKDMCLYKHIPELIDAGVISFKIEGRMRDEQYLLNVINTYSDAIDRYIEDSVGYDRDKGFEELYDNRKRDFSVARAFGEPGLSYINERYEGTGKFYSTGKPFSNPTEEFSGKKETLDQILESVSGPVSSGHKPGLSVRVNDLDQAMAALELGADVLYLSTEPIRDSKPITRSQIKHLIASKGQSKIYLALPRMMDDDLIFKYTQYLKADTMGLDGVLVTHLGAVKPFSQFDFELIGDFSLNVFNNGTFDFYKNSGVSGVTASLELSRTRLAHLIDDNAPNLEIIVHGKPTVMYMDQDLYVNTEVIEPTGNATDTGDEGVVYLIDDAGNRHPVHKDNFGRNHFINTKELCLVELVPALSIRGVKTIRFEGAAYNLNDFKQILKVYRGVVDGIISPADALVLLNLERNLMTFGALQFE